MQPLKADGVFWLPNQPDKQIAGRLEFSPEAGGSLALIGAFGEFANILTIDDDVPTIRILGVAGRKLVTLDQCFRTHTGLESPGILKERYSVGRLLLGAHWEESDSLEFDSLIVSFDQLPNWVLRSGLSVSLETTKVEGQHEEVTKIAATLEALEQETVDLDELKLSIGFTWSMGGDRISTFQLDQGSYFKLEYSSVQPLDDILMDVDAIRHLITLAADTPAAITELSVSAPTLLHPMDASRRQWVDLVQQQTIQVADAAAQHFDMLYLYDKIGGLATVGGWLKTARLR